MHSQREPLWCLSQPCWRYDNLLQSPVLQTPTPTTPRESNQALALTGNDPHTTLDTSDMLSDCEVYSLIALTWIFDPKFVSTHGVCLPNQIYPDCSFDRTYKWCTVQSISKHRLIQCSTTYSRTCLLTDAEIAFPPCSPQLECLVFFQIVLPHGLQSATRLRRSISLGTSPAKDGYHACTSH